MDTFGLVAIQFLVNYLSIFSYATKKEFATSWDALEPHGYRAILPDHQINTDR